jgi:hypothetical protein
MSTANVGFIGLGDQVPDGRGAYRGRIVSIYGRAPRDGATLRRTSWTRRRTLTARSKCCASACRATRNYNPCCSIRSWPTNCRMARPSSITPPVIERKPRQLHTGCPQRPSRGTAPDERGYPRRKDRFCTARSVNRTRRATDGHLEPRDSPQRQSTIAQHGTSLDARLDGAPQRSARRPSRVRRRYPGEIQFDDLACRDLFHTGRARHHYGLLCYTLV